jgi:6-phosphogluconolactonase
MNLEVVVAPLPELVTVCVDRFETACADAIAARGHFACALPGGSVATAFFPALATAHVPWDKVDLFWADERCVAPHDADSNYGLAHRLWLAHRPPRAPRVHRMRGEMPDPNAAAAAAEHALLEVLGAPPRLDVVLLGVGPDGHVASLFPGHPALRERTRWVVAIDDAPKPPPARLTLTLPALALAHSIWIAALGDSKAGVVHAMLEEPASLLPAALATRASAATLWLLDTGAARKLTKRSRLG